MANLSDHYATALFELSLSDNDIDTLFEHAEFLLNSFHGEDGALRILAHPLIPTNEKDNFIDTVYSGIHKNLLGFMKLAVAKNREAFLSASLARLVELIRKHRHYTCARVVSATPLSEVQRHKLTTMLGVKLGKKVEIEAVIDPMQIAGLSVHVDGYFMDCTVNGKLKGLRGSLVNHAGSL